MKYATLLVFLLGCLTNSTNAQEITFEHTSNEEHFILMILSDKWADMNDISKGLTRYNYIKHAGANLSTTRLKMDFISTKKPVMKVKGFLNKQEAMNYYHQFKADNPDFAQMKTIKQVLVISELNFQIMLRAMSIEEYEAFFKENY